MMHPFIAKAEYDSFDDEEKQRAVAILVCHGQLERYFGTCEQCDGPAMFRGHAEGLENGYVCVTCGWFYALDESLPWPVLAWNAEAMENHFEEQGF